MKNTDYSLLKIMILIGIFCSLLLIILLIGSPTPLGLSDDDDEINTVQAVEIDLVQYRNQYQYTRNFIGQIEAQQSTQAGFEVAGMLKHINVDEGDAIQAGDVLAELDTDRLNARQNEAEALLSRAKSDASLAASTYQRFKEAHQANAVSSQELDEAREAKGNTIAAVNFAKAQLNSVLVDIEKSKMVAPFDGVIVHQIIDKGTVVNAGTPVLEIQQHSNFDVRVGVTNKVVNQLKIGETKKIKVHDKEYEVVVDSILPVRGQNRVIDAILKLKKNDGFFRPGDVVRLPIEYNIQARGFWVPLTTLEEGARGLWSLYVVKEKPHDEKDISPTLYAERRTVEVHYMGNNEAFVSGAVKNREKVITKGASKLVPGQQIRIVRSSNNE